MLPVVNHVMELAAYWAPKQLCGDWSRSSKAILTAARQAIAYHGHSTH